MKRFCNILSFCLKQVINTTSEELSDVAIEASVWDLEGTCPYYKVHESPSVPPKKVVPVVEMKYPKSENAKPVYFLLLKLYKKSDYEILSRNFYWLHLSGGDYKLLEPYKKRKVPLKITSKVSIEGPTFDIQMHVQNTSKRVDSKLLSLKHGSTASCSDVSFNTESLEKIDGGNGKEQEVGLLKRVYRCLAGKNDEHRVAEINGDDVGVAFFLHLSVHASKREHKEGEDTRILPVHYSDNYFSLVPGEAMPIRISFKVPPGVTPRITLHGWNYHGQTVLEAL